MVDTASPEEARRLAEEEHLSHRDIAVRLGVHRHTVFRWLHPQRRREQRQQRQQEPRFSTRPAAELAETARRGVCQYARANALDQGQPHVIAAAQLVRGLEARADHWDEEYGPMWLGWALHAAFLAGVAWARRQK